MLCNGLLRSASFLVGYIGRYSEVGNLVCICGTSKHTNLVAYWTNRSFLRTRSMMVDFGSTAKGTMPDFTLPRDEDGGVASGGWKREKGRPSCGYSSFKGKRATMEDFFDIKFSEIDGQSVCLFGIFDGHGGSRAAEYLKNHLFENLMKHPEFISNTKLAISETYQQTDTAFLESEKDTSRDDGSTASTAVLVGNRLYVANVGDSRTIMSKTGKAIPLSEDHKPDRIDERKRIENAGGVVIWAGTWRVGGILAMSRAFGNRMLKQFVVAEPDIQEQEVDQDLEILVLASDGLWDVIPNEESILIGQSEEDPEAAARKLAETAFSHGSADNITCIVVKFHHVAPEPLDRPSHQEHPPQGSAPHPEPESQPAGTKLESKPEPSPPQGSAPHLEPESQLSGTKLESKPKPNAKPTA